MEISDGKGFKNFIDASNSSISDNGLFDASHYAFFGKDVVDEVELGGLEEEESSLAIGGGFGGEDELHEYHLFDKNEIDKACMSIWWACCCLHVYKFRAGGSLSSRGKNGERAIDYQGK